MRNLLLTTAFALPLSITPALAQDATAPVEDPAVAATTETMPEADPAAEQEAMAAEVAASGKVAQQQAMNELRLEWITDAAVTAPDGTKIGDINDLIVDGENGQMIAAIIGVGGFLGIGQKQIAVPWDQLTVNYDAQEISSDLTKEEADAAPEYVFRDREDAPSVTPAADGTAAPVTDPALVPADTTMPAETMPADDATGTMETEPVMPEATDAAPMDDLPAETPANN